ncbi:UNVERIFIED_CONTAM: hypothetical protein Sangu_1166900 [Sesamum angustifolium]|uniref:Uncharacterized protein n=1 Tax=Sesamum angustifolium TaxID=2727405 RepID=A0AAW2P400_9LAMI
MEEPLHLLEAFRRLLVSDCFEPKKHHLCFKCKWLCCFRVEQEPHSSKSSWSKSRFGPIANANLATGVSSATSTYNKFLCCSRVQETHATNLKAKGIYFKPSSSQSLKDAKFNSYLVYAQLELPTWGVSIYTKVFFLNMLAYEMSPNNINNGVVTSYINLMKSLIECTEDVKELREQKILYNMLGSDEQVRDVYKEIKTYGNPPVFHDLQKKIQAHYNSKMKTWIAELIHTHFRTPWTVIGLLAAMSLLALASINVYYSIHKKSNK